MRQKRAYRYRCYPTPEQAATLARTFGCARYVYNWALRVRTDAYYARHERIGYHEASAAPTALKQQPETAWLNEVSSVPLQQALRHLESAFRHFFEGRAKYPVFKQKRGRQAATYASSAFRWDAQTHTLTLAKMEAPLDIHWSRAFTGTPSTVTVSKDSAGRYFVSFLVEEDIQPLAVVQAMVGVDVGVKDVAVLSTGEKVANPRHLRRSERRLAHAQRNLARKQLGSKNRDKARLKVARIHAKIADQRLDGLHKLTTRLIRENQVICVESLAAKNLVRNHSLAKRIGDAGWGELGRAGAPAGLQGRLVRAHAGPDRPLVPPFPTLSRLRIHQRGVDPGYPPVDLPELWRLPRPGHQRRQEHACRGAHGERRWRGGKTGAGHVAHARPGTSR
jgi:putative transposase